MGKTFVIGNYELDPTIQVIEIIFAAANWPQEQRELDPDLQLNIYLSYLAKMRRKTLTGPRCRRESEFGT